MRKIVLMLSSLLIVLAVAGCHTVKGVGEDIQSGGKALSNASGE
ncbi:entericidin A/B family lipoprotein [Frischella sp. Ac13]|uniref:Entericidin A/B family lipoprotein n=1 Tax=Frischella japonica TaxID=2741544 RepID=A0ABR7QV56_9GAMM|nr:MULTISPECIES: entericidin A/B family lipoprotein [Frischella]MBC9130102.1 entericidin A/B family lipoprotein [Frischella japonica]